MKILKKYYKLIILVIVCFLIYFIYNETGNKNITYISLGDGYAKGINPYGKENYGYSDYLKSYLENNNRLYKYYNEYAHKNFLIKDLYNDILINKYEDKIDIKQALRNSNILTLSIGLNDLIYKNSIKNNLDNLTQEEIVDSILLDLDILIDEIKKYYNGKIYLIGYYNFYKDNELKQGLDKLNEKYKLYADNNNINYIEIKKDLSCYYDNPNIYYPNTLGYKEIYKEIVNHLEINY